MTLKIKTTRSELSNGFCKYLLNRLQQDILNNIVKSKYKKYDEELNKSDEIKFITSKYTLHFSDILRQGVYDLKLKKIDSFNYEIFIDPNTLIYNTRNKLVSLIKYVEYGNLRLKPILLFRYIFNLYSQNIQDVFNDYLITTGALIWVFSYMIQQ